MSDPWAEIDKIRVEIGKIRREYWAMHDDLRGWLRLAKCLRAIRDIPANGGAR